VSIAIYSAQRNRPMSKQLTLAAALSFVATLAAALVHGGAIA
jgi:hypothetical protein